MTVEIRELIIQAKVTDASSSQSANSHIQTFAATQRQNEQLVDLITRRVLEQLQEKGWGKR